MEITDFKIRASYPNYYMVNRFAQEGPEIFNHDSEDPLNPLEGNKPGTVVYRTEDGKIHEFPPRWYDMFYLLKQSRQGQLRYLQLLLAGEREQLAAIRQQFRDECRTYTAAHPIIENSMLISSLSQGRYSDEQISHKGRMLLDLTRNAYPVPDFCILTAESFTRHEALPELLENAISNLETMTRCSLGDDRHPLVFAIRCAMPQYIPGLMPTLLNIGVTHKAYLALKAAHGDHASNRIYLSTLHSLAQMLHISNRYDTTDIQLSEEDQFQRISDLEERITKASPDGHRLLTDPHYQSLRLVQHVRDFYIQHQDLILTFMQGKQAHPSLILQRMVWTIGNNDSYPGVLHSRHSRTGKGRQIESCRNIFGEEIMTGDATTQDNAYHDRNEIINHFPAVYHFDPLLKKLESRYASPVTIEFAVESRPNQLSLFSVLQLNISEMTGRAALISAIDLYNNHLIDETHVMDLIKPYHLRQIVSASIDDHSLSTLTPFGKGLSVLPRTAISAVLCFSPTAARTLKAKGENVCLCQERFIPEDTITLNEVDAILSISPAAIHVVTACRGYGIPALMDLQNYGLSIVVDPDGSPELRNGDGLAIAEGEHLTISCKRQAIYKGVADFKPARFTKYLQGQPVPLNDDEQQYFREMKEAYEQYQGIVTSDKASYINDVETLARLIRCDLKNKPETARQIVNSWFDNHAQQYINQVLQSRMGDHQDQSRVFDLLSHNRKSLFFREAAKVCTATHRSGLTAGSFMLGRFVSKPLPTSLWNNLSHLAVAFLLNEYVLYEKYLHVLEEVGEIRLTRAHSRIETDGIDNMKIENFDLYTFVPLLYSSHDWPLVADALETIDHQDNTHLLVQKLSQPLSQLFDLSKPWVTQRLSLLKDLNE